MDSVTLDPFLKLLADVSPPKTVRDMEPTGDVSALWTVIQESGLLDAMVPEDRGGAGLAAEDVSAVVIGCGEHLVPAPVAETIVGRAIIAHSGAAIPVDGPIVLWPQSADGMLRSQCAPTFCRGAFALTQLGDTFTLVELHAGDPDAFNLTPASIKPSAGTLIAFERQGVDLMSWAGAILAASMAGAMNTVLAISIDHASTRIQFGRPLSKFQAIQHHLAVMAEQVASANAAARFAFMTNTRVQNPWRAAVAKCIVNEAAELTCGLAHTVHGAIGISKEHDLQLYTRRLKRWQLSFGSESYWAREIVKPWFASSGGTSIDVIRQQTGPAADTAHP